MAQFHLARRAGSPSSTGKRKKEGINLSIAQGRFAGNLGDLRSGWRQACDFPPFSHSPHSVLSMHPAGPGTDQTSNYARRMRWGELPLLSVGQARHESRPSTSHRHWARNESLVSAPASLFRAIMRPTLCRCESRVDQRQVKAELIAEAPGQAKQRLVVARILFALLSGLGLAGASASASQSVPAMEGSYSASGRILIKMR
jgi:hypothetical protein